MHDLIELLTQWADEVQKLDTADLIQLLKLGARVVALLELKSRLPRIGRGMRQQRIEAPEDVAADDRRPPVDDAERGR
jgi:hypothetical protein